VGAFIGERLGVFRLLDHREKDYDLGSVVGHNW
jgi:hypothetical protein